MTLVSLVMRLGPVLSAVYASLLLLVSFARLSLTAYACRSLRAANRVSRERRRVSETDGIRREKPRRLRNDR